MSAPLRPTHAAILYNPQRVALHRLKRAVAAAERSAGYGPSLWLQTDGNGSHGPLGEARASGPAVVIAAGGDGTVRQIGSALAGTGMPFGIIPSGTANLLARNLGIPQYDTDRAALVAFSGVERAIDIGVLEYRLEDGTSGRLDYFVMAGFGIDADMVAESDPVMKRRFGWMAYVGPILRSLVRKTSHQARYSLDDAEPVSGQLHTLIVGNSGTVTAGLKLLPDARLDDGMFDVLAIRSMRPRDRRTFIRWLGQSQGPATIWPHVDPAATGGALHYAQAATVSVSLDTGAMFQADGDAIGSIVEAHFSVLAGAIVVRAAG
ncbi:MAG TPA: diacylglycerol kinase family protein [Microbacteriaceae bacterium]|jgi:diacylglycerol kinase family enzyme|nr:diacylglycerol kinase family protein [Microbacteriaceae bacterium]